MDVIIVSKEKGEFIFYWKGQKIKIAQELYTLILEDIVEEGDRIYTKPHVILNERNIKEYQTIQVLLPPKSPNLT
jgi:hypothetical protein